MADELEEPAPRPASSGIPEEPEGTPQLGERASEHDDGTPPGPTPPMDFWEALYGRRSIRKFDPRPVPRELVTQVLHAGIWAPSSCNYQMWDLVVVDDPAVNAELARLSLQMANAPVNVVVSYGRDFSEEAWANVQSASALVQNMSLAAHVLGLGTFWITQMGDAERVREVVGLPRDRLVIAVLALGYPKFAPKKGPKRRPLAQVAHWNHYTGSPIPSSPDPAAWSREHLAIYQRARVLNGLRHNKPRAWETRALLEALDALVPAPAAASGAPARAGAPAPDAASAPDVADPRAPDVHAPAPRWLDVLPCTGILLERIARERPGYRYDVVERTPEVADFVARRVRPRAGTFAWPEPHPASDGRAAFAAPPDGAYDVVSCLFRLEDQPPDDRAELVRALARWTRPGGAVLLGFVSARSFHEWTERLRARRGGPKGVEYVLSPDPNIGPFLALDPGQVERLCAGAGLVVERRLGLQAVPQPEEIAFRARNFSPRNRRLAGAIGKGLAAVERLPGVRASRGRFRFLRLRRPLG